MPRQNKRDDEGNKLPEKVSVSVNKECGGQQSPRSPVATAKSSTFLLRTAEAVTSPTAPLAPPSLAFVINVRARSNWLKTQSESVGTSVAKQKWVKKRSYSPSWKMATLIFKCCYLTIRCGRKMPLLLQKVPDLRAHGLRVIGI